MSPLMGLTKLSTTDFGKIYVFQGGHGALLEVNIFIRLRTSN
jgi:hypothetical protein